MLKIYEEVLGLKFKLTENPHVWHPDVTQYSVYDGESNDFIGHFYLDLHPREGKYGHAAEFGLVPSSTVNGKVNHPIAAMVANFSKSTATKPSLLKHNEVVVYFHEFGHVMHELNSTAKFSLLAGTSVQRDFVETPSQMLENWCYESSILSRLSKHYLSGETLPEAFGTQLAAARRACAPLLSKRQLFLGYFDMHCHTVEGPINSAEVWTSLRKKITLLDSYTMIVAPPNTNGSAAFGHLMGGYQAGYYGYLWSEVFSSDLYTAFQKNGTLDKETGKRYRNKILAPGATRDASELLKDFLGREPNDEAFLISLNLKAKN